MELCEKALPPEMIEQQEKMKGKKKKDVKCTKEAVEQFTAGLVTGNFEGESLAIAEAFQAAYDGNAEELGFDNDDEKAIFTESLKGAHDRIVAAAKIAGIELTEAAPTAE